jgi:hypothetical protein
MNKIEKLSMAKNLQVPYTAYIFVSPASGYLRWLIYGDAYSEAYWW